MAVVEADGEEMDEVQADLEVVVEEVEVEDVVDGSYKLILILSKIKETWNILIIMDWGSTHAPLMGTNVNPYAKIYRDLLYMMHEIP